MSNESMSLGELQGAPSFKFEEVGDRVSGRIVSIRKRQSTDMDTGELLTWANGDPRMFTAVTLVNDADGEEVAVNGAGGKFEPAKGKGTSFETALLAAGRAAKVGSIDAGGHLEVVHSGLGKKPSAGKNAPKLYTISYTPPNASLKLDGEAGDEPDLFSQNDG
jgi:hypothetical protein